jgi:hypothetical protein
MILEANIMKATLPMLLTLLLLSAVVLSPITTNGQTESSPPTLELDQNDIDAEDEDSAEDAAPVERVARITFIQGDVSFLRSGVSEWSDAAENLPLLTGDQVYVGSGGRVEIQFGRGNYVRLSEKTALTITELSDTAALLEVTEGIAIIRLEKYGSAWERFEVDTPNSALVLKQDGLYRVNVRGEDDSEVIIRRGTAEVFAEDGNFKVRDGQRLTIDTSPNGKLQIAIDNSNDEWDRWTYDRDRQADYIAVSSAPDYVRQYENDYQGFYGASDLTSYGFWTSYSSYGNCWVPRVSAGWAPYRSGQWIWIPRTGWTWLSNEPWGWAPYHYGRWVYLNNIGWAWAPGFHTNRYTYGRSYYQWRPALVSFFNCPTPRGNYIGWYPLAPGQRWRRSGNFGGDGFRGNNRNRHLQYPVARDANRRPNGGRNTGGNGFGNGGNRPKFGNGNGVTVLPVEGFAGTGRTKFKPNAPNAELANSFTKGARAGLPDFGNNTNSFVNAKVARHGDSSNGLRPVVRPPQEVFRRSVVTRQRPTETQAETVAPRERRYIGAPGMKPYGSETPDNRRARRGEGIGGSNTGSQGGETTSGETKFERKQRMKNGESSGGSVNNGSSNGANGNSGIITDDAIKNRLNRSGQDTIETRKGGASNNDDLSPNGKTRNRPATGDQNGGSTTESDANRRVYVPREKPREDTPNVEERRQEKQERRQQQQQDQQQQQEQQQREERERQQRRAERQEQERQQQQQQEQERQQRRAERQQQEQQQQEQQRREQEQQREQRRAERQQQQEQQRQQQQQEQQRQQQQQQEQQRQQQQQEQQRREEKQQRKKGDN